MIGENISAYFSMLGVAASWQPSGGGAVQAGRAIIDLPDQAYLGDIVVSGALTVYYPATQWAALAEDQNIIVDGNTYRVRSVPRREDDGAMMRAEVSR